MTTGADQGGKHSDGSPAVAPDEKQTTETGSSGPSQDAVQPAASGGEPATDPATPKDDLAERFAAIAAARQGPAAGEEDPPEVATAAENGEEKPKPETKPEGETEADEDPNRYELTADDKARGRRSQERIKALLDRQKALDSELKAAQEAGGLPPEIRKVTEKAQLADAELAAGVKLLGAYKLGLPDAAPHLARMANELREDQGLAPLIELPAVDKLPAWIADARELGVVSWDDERAKAHAALDAYLDQNKGGAATATTAGKAEAAAPATGLSRADLEALDKSLGEWFTTDKVAKPEDHAREVWAEVGKEHSIESLRAMSRAQVEKVLRLAHKAVLVERRAQALAQQEAAGRARGATAGGMRQPPPRSKTTTTPRSLDEAVAQAWPVAARA